MRGIVETARSIGLEDRIRAEAERRIDAGILVNGLPFRCDEKSTQRVGEFVTAFADGLVGAEGLRFRTRGGTSITLAGRDQAQALYDAQRRYRLACLARSDSLQATASEEYRSDSAWPALESIAL